MARKKQIKSPKISLSSKPELSLTQKAVQTYNVIEPWIPWILAAVYTTAMAVLAFRYHSVGSQGVETDFYAETYPQARKLIEGKFSPLNYSAKGPVYSILLAIIYLPVREYFVAGQILNLIGCAVFIVGMYFLVKTVFNSLAALLVTLIVIFNSMFQHMTYEVCSDIPFMAFCVLSMLFLFKNGRRRDIILSAVFGLLAFLTRYNGAFIAAGSVLFYAVEKEPVKKRMKKTGLWIGVFVVAGMPWFISNWISAGSPVHNDNYVNVMLEFYGKRQDGFNYESWIDALPKEFTGIGDIFMYDPVYFVKKIGSNVREHFFLDMKELVQWRLGILILLGVPLFFFTKPDRRKYVYFSFGAAYFLILTLVFYNARFSMYLLMFYLPLAVLPFTSKRLTSRLGKFSHAPVVLLALIIGTYAFTSTRVMLRDIKVNMVFLKEIGLALNKIESDSTAKIIARKPHTSYYADMVPRMFPNDVQTVEELVAYCRKNDIKYVLYSLVERNFRPQLDVLYSADKQFPGLERVYVSRYGVAYRVIE
ncbi:ArnT family glycosyltransferase [Candidatus Omnitrophota bacterium]